MRCSTYRPRATWPRATRVPVRRSGRAWLVLLVWLAVGAAFAGQLSAQESAPSRPVPRADCAAPARLVRIVDSVQRTPVTGAILTLLAEPASGDTAPRVLGQRRLASDGECVDPGRARSIRVRRLGYVPVSLPLGAVDADARGDRAITILLAPIPMEFAPLRRTAVRGVAGRSAESRFGGATIVLTPQARAMVPAVGGADVLRSLELVAPVAVRSEFSPGVAVYGSDPDQTRLELEGIPLLGAQHMGGVFSALPADAIGAVVPLPATARTSPGGAGGTIGGRVQAALRTDSVPGVHGSVESSVIGSALTVRAQGERRAWELTAAGRVSTIDRLAAAVRPPGFPYRFDDALLAGSIGTPRGGRLVVLGVRTRDRLRLGSSGTGVDQAIVFDTVGAGLPDADWSSRTVGGRLEQPLGALTLNATASDARTDVAAWLSFGKLGMGSRLDLTSAALSLATTRSLVRGVPLVELGVSGTRASSQSSLTLFRAPANLPETRVEATSAWTEANVPLGATLAARIGVRFESVPAAAWQGVLPDVGFSWRHPSRPVRVDVSAGRSAQWLHSATPDGSLATAVDFWLLSGRDVPVATGTEVVAGVHLGSDSASRALHVTTWVRRAHDVPDRPPAVSPFGAAQSLQPAAAANQGIDVRLVARHASGGLLVLGYTLASSTRERDGITWPSLADRRHTVSALAGLPLGSRTTVSLTWLWHTGLPTTEETGVFYQRVRDPYTGGWMRGELMEIHGPPHAIRLPAYSRVDVQLGRTLVDRPAARVRLTAGVINVLNRHNPLQYEWVYTAPPATRTLRGQMPILPSIGLTASF